MKCYSQPLSTFLHSNEIDLNACGLSKTCSDCSIQVKNCANGTAGRFIEMIGKYIDI